MVDREKVIKGLECCIVLNGGLMERDCEDCPYIDDEGTCLSLIPLLEDALGLLKEQEDSIPLKPLAKWMAKYAYCYGLAICTNPKITEEKRQTTLAEMWEEVFRGMKWEDTND